MDKLLKNRSALKGCMRLERVFLPLAEPLYPHSPYRLCLYGLKT